MRTKLSDNYICYNDYKSIGIYNIEYRKVILVGELHKDEILKCPEHSHKHVSIDKIIDVMNERSNNYIILLEVDDQILSIYDNIFKKIKSKNIRIMADKIIKDNKSFITIDPRRKIFGNDYIYLYNFIDEKNQIVNANYIINKDRVKFYNNNLLNFVESEMSTTSDENLLKQLEMLKSDCNYINDQLLLTYTPYIAAHLHYVLIHTGKKLVDYNILKKIVNYPTSDFLVLVGEEHAKNLRDIFINFGKYEKIVNDFNESNCYQLKQLNNYV